jgi:hypothetical protein
MTIKNKNKNKKRGDPLFIFMLIDELHTLIFIHHV